MTSTHPAFDAALAELRRRKGIVYPPPDPDTDPPGDDDDAEVAAPRTPAKRPDRVSGR